MKADGVLTCYNCDGQAHDAIDEWKGKALLECCYCNVRVWTSAFQFPKKKNTGIRLQHGRHAGKTYDEVAAEPNGIQYLRWLASTNEKLRPSINEYLAAAPQA